MSKGKKMAISIVKTTFFPVVFLSLVSGYLLLPLYDHVIPKNYSAKSQFMVEEKKDSTNRYSEDQSSKYLSNYNLLIFGDIILEPVQKKLGGDKKYSIDEIKSYLNVIYSADSQIITIEIITDNKNESIKIANLILDETLNRIPKIVTANNLKEVAKANRVVEYSKLSKATYLGVTTILFMIFFSLIVTYMFAVNQQLYCKAQIKSLLGNKNVYEI